MLEAGGDLTLNLHRTDFTTVARMVDAINRMYGPGVARAVDGVTVAVSAPSDPGMRISFLSQIENLELTPGTAPAKVIVNARTGTVVIGSQVRVMPAAVTHGALTVTINEGVQVSQPGAFAGGGTVATPTSSISSSQEGSRINPQQTGRALDVMINGRGFFEVLMPDGSSAYTRDGSFQVNAQGELVTSSGYPVQPGIQIPEGAQSMTIGTDGTITVQMAGDGQALEIGALTLTDFINPAGLQARGENLYLGAGTLELSLDISGSTQYGSNFALRSVNQDGVASGKLTEIDVSEDGVVYARYSNGEDDRDHRPVTGVRA